jgi:hypothetical protein
MTVLIEEVHDIELDGQRPEADSEGTRTAQTMDSSTDVTTELQREVLRLREQLSEIGIEPDIGNDIMQRQVQSHAQDILVSFESLNISRRYLDNSQRRAEHSSIRLCFTLSVLVVMKLGEDWVLRMITW